MRARARRNVVEASIVAVVGFLLIATLGATAAMANAASPTASPLATGSVLLNANGTVTVNASGTWLWAFGTESATTAGLDATVNHPCDTRTGVGWGIVWNDPNDPGFTETYINKHGPPASATVHVGSKGINPLNGDDQVEYNAAHKCGTFVQTNVPKPGDGYDTGIWTGTHVYESVASLPTSVCVITYDLGFAKPPSAHRTSFDNNDNSVQWALFKQGYWNTTTMGVSCAQLPPPVAAPPVSTPPPAPAPVKTVSHTSPPAPKVPAAVKPSTSPLAFTGFGETGRIIAVLGAVLVLIGLVLYFVDVRKVVLWLLGM
jgi:hypothetical protein